MRIYLKRFILTVTFAITVRNTNPIKKRDVKCAWVLIEITCRLGDRFYMKPSKGKALELVCRPKRCANDPLSKTRKDDARDCPLSCHSIQ